MVMKMIPFFQRKHWVALIARVFSLVLVIGLALPTFAANAAAPGPEGHWQLIDSPITIELFDGQDFGRMYCNSYFGGYLTPRDAPPSDCGRPAPIRFTPQASTKVGCRENPLEAQYLRSLEGARAYEVCDDMLTLATFPAPLQFHRISY